MWLFNLVIGQLLLQVQAAFSVAVQSALVLQL